VALLGQPLAISSDLTENKLEEERQKVEKLMVELDEKADLYFH